MCCFLCAAKGILQVYGNNCFLIYNKIQQSEYEMHARASFVHKCLSALISISCGFIPYCERSILKVLEPY